MLANDHEYDVLVRCVNDISRFRSVLRTGRGDNVSLVLTEGHC